MKFNSLAGQFIVATMVTVLVVNAILITKIVRSDQILDNIELQQTLKKAARVYQLVSEASAIERGNIAQLASDPLVGFLIVNEPGGTLSKLQSESELRMSQILPGQSFHFSSNARELGKVLVLSLLEEDDNCFRIQTSDQFVETCPHRAFYFPLTNGTWLQANTQPSSSAIEIFFDTIFISLLLTLLGVSTAVFWIARRVSKPIESLAEQSEHLGRGENTETLKVTGPVEVRRLVATFNRMQLRLKRYVSDRSQMLAAISHDLRTPITSLRVRVEFIEDQNLRAEMIQTLDEMNQMIGSCLAMSRDQNSEEQKKDVDLAILISDIIQDSANTSLETQLKELVYRCEVTHMKRAVRNLVDNAIKYGKCAHVELESSSSLISITVWDEGDGVPEAEFDRIFTPFVRLDTARHTDDGSVGLGLAITRGIVHRHGGKIFPTRQGDRFGMRITLPV